MDSNQPLRDHLLTLLKEGGAHVNFEGAVDELPGPLRGAKPLGVAHSPWQLVEHMRIAQWDILEFSRNPGHVSPQFPEGYWPQRDAPADEAAWEKSVAGFLADRAALCALVADAGTDLFKPLAHGQGQTILREALLAADHSAYHVGQLVVVRRALGAWPVES